MKVPLQVLPLLLLAPCCVLSCRCPEGALDISISDAIRIDFFKTFNSEVYVGMVIAATCNCLPGNSTTEMSSLNCQRYELDLARTAINNTILTRGECDADYTDMPVCDDLEASIRTWGLQVEGAVLGGGSEELVDFTGDNGGCDLACPFNQQERDPQPCVYAVRVTEVFKGTYSPGDVIEATGPDVITSCGALGRVLHVSSRYVVGIGNPCSPIAEWTDILEYSNEDLDLLGSLVGVTQATPPVTAVGGGGRTLLSSIALTLFIVGCTQLLFKL